MRRKDRERGRDFALEVMDKCEYGTAAFITEPDEAPYCIPLSLVRDGDILYFHCAKEGRKLELMRRNPKVCVSFVGSNVTAEDKFTTYFSCAQVIGTAFEVTEDREKIEALRRLCQKLTPGIMDMFDQAIARSLGRTAVWGIRMEEITAKEKKMPV